MTRKTLSLICMCVMSSSTTVRAQLENAHWVVSNSIGLDLRSNPPMQLTGTQTPRPRAMGTISNTEGELLLYADDNQVFNRWHQPMEGAVPTTGGNAVPFQGALVLPVPGDTNTMVVISRPNIIDPEIVTAVHVQTVDLSGAGGMGTVLLADEVLFDSACTAMTAVPHATDQAWWILLHHATASSFHAYLLDSTGSFASAVISEVGTPQPDYLHYNSTQGYLRPSPLGNKLAWAKWYWEDGSTARYVELFDFNAGTGIVSNYMRLDGNARFRTVEFSPNGNFLYASEWVCQDGMASSLWQYDISSGGIDEILATKTLVHAAPEGQYNCHGAHYGMATSPNGLIYVAPYSSHHLGIIEFPDLACPDCNYIHEGLSLGSDTVRGYLPNQPRAYPKADNTAIAERHSASPSLHTWPNPANDQIFVQAQGLLPGRSILRLFAADGRELRQVRPAAWPHTMDVQGLAPGLYLLRLEGPQGSAVTRVVLE